MKGMMDVFAGLVVLPLLGLFRVGSFFRLDGTAMFSAFSQMLSLVPGKSGSYIRKAFYRWTMSYCAPSCVIGFGTIFSQLDTEIGKGVYIGPQCNIGMCRIENDCLLGSGVHILSGKRQHNFGDIENPIQEQGGVYEKVTIGEDTWIGNGAIVSANVGKKCIVGAGAVVVQDVPAFSIVAGNPAKTVKRRKA